MYCISTNRRTWKRSYYWQWRAV